MNSAGWSLAAKCPGSRAGQSARKCPSAPHRPHARKGHQHRRPEPTSSLDRDAAGRAGGRLVQRFRLIQNLRPRLVPQDVSVAQPSRKRQSALTRPMARISNPESHADFNRNSRGQSLRRVPGVVSTHRSLLTTHCPHHFSTHFHSRNKPIKLSTLNCPSPIFHSFGSLFSLFRTKDEKLSLFFQALPHSSKSGFFTTLFQSTTSALFCKTQGVPPLLPFSYLSETGLLSKTVASSAKHSR
jgi:hypothetical protein